MRKGIEINGKLKKRGPIKQQYWNKQCYPGSAAEFENKLPQVKQTQKKIEQGCASKAPLVRQGKSIRRKMKHQGAGMSQSKKGQPEQRQAGVILVDFFMFMLNQKMFIGACTAYALIVLLHRGVKPFVIVMFVLINECGR